MVQHVLVPVNNHFHWNLFIFEFLAIFLIFILATILKILKTKSTTLRDNLFLCQVSKGSAVWGKFNIFCTLVTMATAAILTTHQQLPHTTVDIPTKFHEVWWKESKFFLNPPFFISMATAAKFVLPIAILLAYLIQLDVDVTGNITAKLYEVWSVLNIFCSLVTMATAAILNFFNPQKLPHTTVDIPTKFHEVWWKESKNILNLLFCFHGNCSKVCPTDSDYFGLSRSTRCGCCSYQVSSISVGIVTCFDNFCVFQFFSILAVSMATAAILKKINP